MKTAITAAVFFWLFFFGSLYLAFGQTPLYRLFVTYRCNGRQILATYNYHSRKAAERGAEAFRRSKLKRYSGIWVKKIR